MGLFDKKWNNILIILILYSAIFFFFHQGKIFISGDIEADFIFSVEFINRALYSWAPDSGFGTIQMVYGSMFPIYYIKYLLSYILTFHFIDNLFLLFFNLIPIPLIYSIFLSILKDHKKTFLLSLIFIFSYPLMIANTFLLPFLYARYLLIIYFIYYLLKKDNGIISYPLILIYIISIFVSRNQADFIIFYVIFTLSIILKKLFFEKNVSWLFFIKKWILNLIIMLTLNAVWLISFIFTFFYNIDNYKNDEWNTKVLTSANNFWKEAGIKDFIRGFSHDFFIVWENRLVYDYSIFYTHWFFIFISYGILVYLFYRYILSRNEPKNKFNNIFHIVFISLLATLFLLKGAAQPLGFIYENILSGSFFAVLIRNTTTRFMIYYAIILFIFIAFILSKIKNKVHLYIIILILFLNYNLPIFLTGNILNNRHAISYDRFEPYIEFCEYINYNNKVDNILILPMYNSTLIRLDDFWSGYDILKQCSSKSNWSIGTNLNTYNKNFWDKQKKYFYEDELLNIELFEQYNITDIFWHKDIDPTASMDAEKDLEILNYLNNNVKFSKVKENDDLILFKFNNDNIKPNIYSDNTQFQRINPTKFKININNIDKEQDISFLESFDKQWKLYLNPINSHTKDCNVIQEYNNEGKNIKECEHTQKFFEGEELSYLWRQPVFEDSHKLVYDYANQWTIDPEYIKANFDKSMYKENLDGSIDLELTLYFKPQSYFYLGIIISGTTLILCLSYLGYTFYRQRKQGSRSKIDIHPVGE